MGAHRGFIISAQCHQHRRPGPQLASSARANITAETNNVCNSVVAVLFTHMEVSTDLLALTPVVQPFGTLQSVRFLS